MRGGHSLCCINAPPTIVQPPQGQTSVIGGTVVFVVDAFGSNPLHYQWQLGGTNVAGATNYSLEIANVQATNAGAYRVVVANAFGSITSAPAALTLLFPPAIVTQPQSQTNYAGGNAHLSVVASGSSNLLYQWRFAGANIAGATNSILPLLTAPSVQQWRELFGGGHQSLWFRPEFQRIADRAGPGVRFPACRSCGVVAG